MSLATTSSAKVFSAHAEVVPIAAMIGGVIGGILRARGGSSVVDVSDGADEMYSPRTRR